MRHVKQIYQAQGGHWVGDGFAVQSLFSHMGEARNTSPFLMLDYAAPRYFEPNTATPRGVGAHPHKGFETVTIACMGEVAHRDSTGGGGVIGEGDVQWMTAGAGIVHEEFHSEAFSRKGGWFEMVQLWVNLPAAHKNTPARYQHLPQSRIPVVQQDEAQIRIIAGQHPQAQGAADTFTEMNVWEIMLPENASTDIEVSGSHNLMMVILRGEVGLNGTHTAQAGDLVLFEQTSGQVALAAQSGDAKVLLLSGVPIDEPVAAYGPFVMNTEQELRQAVRDYHNGLFGTIQ